MATMHPWLASHPDAIDWPASHNDMDGEFIERVLAVCSRPALVDIARSSLAVAQGGTSDTALAERHSQHRTQQEPHRHARRSA